MKKMIAIQGAFLLALSVGSSQVAAQHSNLTFSDYPNACLGCHQNEYNEMMDSTHYKWVGESPDMINQPGSAQGKLTNGVNSYCINILGDWPVCGSCHAGRGKRPDDPTAGAENVDCLMCHSDEYATQRKRLADGSMGVDNPTDSMVQNISKPTRAACLMCHAKAGGGDGVKRGDLSIATINNADPDFDVHMNTSGDNLQCQACHVFQNHKTIGKGSDIRPTDDLSRGAEVACTTCHSSMASTGHSNSTIDRHASRGHIACQTCHIPTYAKVATETHRDWTHHHDGSPADGVSGPGHPHIEKEANLTPEYLWWNRLSDNYLLGDDAELTYDAAKDTYPTSRPVGGFMDGKIYPFKYKTAYQPIARGGNCDGQLIALDTLVYLKQTGDVDQAITSGLANMGCTGATVEWINTDTYQLTNHGVEPEENALTCNDCHDMTGQTPDGTKRLNFGELGYHSMPAAVENCTLCHKPKSASFQSLHTLNKHKPGGEYNIQCTDCHTGGEPTGWTKPTSDLCNDCHGYKRPRNFDDDDHKKHIKEGASCTVCHTF
jgi:hypothetical protein